MVGFFVTGFGPFAGVQHNVTEDLVELLNERLPEGLGPAYHVLGTVVLECAAQSVRDWLHTLYNSQVEATAGALASLAPGTPFVVLHMGVDVTAGKVFKLEQRAANEASFRVPDQEGWQPRHQLIDDHPGLTLDTRLHTDLDVAALADWLGRQQHNARPSLDAGRFVCNFTYYLSLLHSQKQRQRQGRPIHTLFLHVPRADVVPLQQQFAFLLDLLASIAQQLAPATPAMMKTSKHTGGDQLVAAVGRVAPDAASNGAAEAAPKVQQPTVEPVKA